MRPKEAQRKLGMTADRIKFFKKQGIFTPENPPSGNHGTDYTENDLEALRFLDVLTKCGLTAGDIKKLQDSECTLEYAVRARQQSIEDDMRRKRNSLELLAQILDDGETFEEFETDRYWNIIKQREEAGEEFIDVEDTYSYRPVSLTREIECPYCKTNQEIDLEDFETDQSSYEKENGMGPDIVYSFDSEDNIECPNCHRKYQVTGWIREYPVGAYDSEDIEVHEIQEE
jgi:DNA-binding transcriptional MerR regulator